ncbi:MAG: MBL fold metallo-hydrolase [Aestuariivita sp.]|nr:MBL fold metallo-hydrolase [Aestuariivita sp.]
MDVSCTNLSYPWRKPPEFGDFIEVASGVFWFRLPLPMKLNHVNVYVLDDGDGWTVVDTGFCAKLSLEIWQSMLAGPLADKPVRRLLVTHHHPDHVGLAGWFQRHHTVELLMSRTAWLFARMLTLDKQEKMVEENVAFFSSAGMSPELLEARKREIPFNFADIVAPLPLGYTRIKHGDIIQMGGRNWSVHVGNGHAPEHLTLWSRDDGLVISGDQILPSISPNIGVYATEPLADPLADWIEACTRLAKLATYNQLVLCGHKLPFTGLPVRMQQLLNHHQQVLDRLLIFLEYPHSAAECFEPLFQRKIHDNEYGLAIVEAIAHVNHLFLSGQVRRFCRTDGAWLYQRKL